MRTLRERIPHPYQFTFGVHFSSGWAYTFIFGYSQGLPNWATNP